MNYTEQNTLITYPFSSGRKTQLTLKVMTAIKSSLAVILKCTHRAFKCLKTEQIRDLLRIKTSQFLNSLQNRAIRSNILISNLVNNENFRLLTTEQTDVFSTD